MSKSFKIILIILIPVVLIVAVLIYYSSLPYEKANGYKSKIITSIAPIVKIIVYPVTFFDNCERYNEKSPIKCPIWCHSQMFAGDCYNSEISLKSIIKNYKRKKEKKEEQGKCFTYSENECLLDDDCYKKFKKSCDSIGDMCWEVYDGCFEKSEEEKLFTKQQHKKCIESGGIWEVGASQLYVSKQYCQCPEELKFNQDSCRKFTEEEIQQEQKCLETGGRWEGPPHEWCYCSYGAYLDMTDIERYKTYLDEGDLVFADKEIGCITEKQQCLEDGKQWIPREYELILYSEKGGVNYQNCVESGGRLYDEYICWIIKSGNSKCVNK